MPKKPAPKIKKSRNRRPPVPKAIPAGRWRKTRREILDRLTDPTRLEVELVDRLILNLIEAEAALKIASANPYTAGSRDQVTEHPGFRIAARCESTALAIASKLGVITLGTTTADNDEEAGPVEKVEDELAAIRKRKTAG
jgi:hypothetical protein